MYFHKPQACVEFQLAVFFCQLGSTGSLFEVCLRFGNRRRDEERKKVNEGFENLGGLKNVIGAVDGTYIPMRNAPNKDPEVYFTRKKCYAIHCQDYSHLIQDDDNLLGDSAYPISPFLIPPFKDTSSRKYKKFNQFHSRHQVVIENAFGRLKARSKTLRDLDIKMVKMEVLFTCCAIILHNFLDIWEGDFNDNIEEDDNDKNDNYTLRNNDEVLKRTGQAKKNLIFHQHFS
ncbi:unnamed protein product [Rhizophagus irregularis]|nr:unnamed protein product [Rhizophagus irregularis]